LVESNLILPWGTGSINLQVEGINVTYDVVNNLLSVKIIWKKN